MIFVVANDFILAKTIRKACRKITDEPICIDNDPFTAIETILTFARPNLIFLQSLLIGANAFAFLNELYSHEDFLSIPIVLLNDLKSLGGITPSDLEDYNIKAILQIDRMTPRSIRKVFRRYHLNNKKIPQRSAKGAS